MSDRIIELNGVRKGFGKKDVLRELTLEVPRGQTYALLGRNGAGKTTTIRLLLGLIPPEAGTVNVLGLDPCRKAIEIRRRTGYLAEDQTLFGWMRVSQILGFLSPFYPTWDRELAEKYRKLFELPPRTRIRNLSKGQKVRLGLLMALAHRPELVILDDPTLGLDPILRKEFLRDVVTHLQGRGATVFFSSHLLYEVEPVADSVAILEGGRIVRRAPTEELREDVKRFILAAGEFDRLENPEGILDVQRRGSQVAITTEGAGKMIEVLRSSGIRPEVVNLNLDEIFEAYVIGRRSDGSDL